MILDLRDSFFSEIASYFQEYKLKLRKNEKCKELKKLKF